MPSTSQIYQALAKQVVGSHLEHQSTTASPMLTALHPTSETRATLEVTGTLPQASAWGQESVIMHKTQELLHLGWESKVEEKPPYDKANNDFS